MTERNTIAHYTTLHYPTLQTIKESNSSMDELYLIFIARTFRIADDKYIASTKENLSDETKLTRPTRMKTRSTDILSSKD